MWTASGNASLSTTDHASITWTASDTCLFFPALFPSQPITPRPLGRGNFSALVAASIASWAHPHTSLYFPTTVWLSVLMALHTDINLN